MIIVPGAASTVGRVSQCPAVERPLYDDVVWLHGTRQYRWTSRLDDQRLRLHHEPRYCLTCLTCTRDARASEAIGTTVSTTCPRLLRSSALHSLTIQPRIEPLDCKSDIQITAPHASKQRLQNCYWNSEITQRSVDGSVVMHSENFDDTRLRAFLCRLNYCRLCAEKFYVPRVTFLQCCGHAKGFSCDTNAVRCRNISITLPIESWFECVIRLALPILPTLIYWT